MDASKKQREPVAFKSLAELKRFIRPGVEIKTVSHANHADMVGLTRVVTTVQTVGFYSKIKDQPEHPFSTCNHGKGFYTDFGKAGNYIFDGTTVKVKDTRKQDRGVIYELVFYDITASADEPLLTSIERAGITAPSRCRSGECSWCRSKLVSGEVFVPEKTDGRRRADIEFGYIHPCASFPMSDIVLDVPNSTLK